MAWPASEASAEGLFEMLFGGFRRATAAAPSQGGAYTDPFGAPAPGAEAGGGRAYCVRLCDGRFFPIQRHAEASSAQLCGALCPASKTKVFSGGSIDRATATDGSRYADLGTAFAFRAKMVPNCTCNGKDALGLAPIDISADPTLHPGDVVATHAGLMAFTGGRSRRGAAEPDFTPVGSYSGLPADVRNRLANTTVAPASE